MWDTLSEKDFKLGDSEAIDLLLAKDDSEYCDTQQQTSCRFAAGTRVAFECNLEALLTYPKVPECSEGSVITVRTSSGDVTKQGTRVFVSWDDGQVLPIEECHLSVASSQKTASSYRRRVSSLGDLSDFFVQKKSDLVHKATKDLWRFSGENGEYVIERLFDEQGKPLKDI